jgi:hypothetical protein
MLEGEAPEVPRSVRSFSVPNGSSSLPDADRTTRAERARSQLSDLISVALTVFGARRGTEDKLAEFLIAKTRGISVAVSAIWELIITGGGDADVICRARKMVGQAVSGEYPPGLNLFEHGRDEDPDQHIREALHKWTGLARVDQAVALAEPGSPMWNFASAWRKAVATRSIVPKKSAPWYAPVSGWFSGVFGGCRKDTEQDVCWEELIVSSIVTGNISELGRLIGGRPVDAIRIDGKFLSQANLALRPARCSLLSVAAGADSLESVRFLLGLCEATVTCDTVRMAVATGDVELIKMVWVRLSAQEEARLTLLETAAEWHQPEPLLWLLGDATKDEQRIFLTFANAKHLAAALLIAESIEVVPWQGAEPGWWRSEEGSFRLLECGEGWARDVAQVKAGNPKAINLPPARLRFRATRSAAAAASSGP